MSAHYLMEKNRKRVAVLLDIEEYECTVEEPKKFENILGRRAYDEAKAELERGEDELIPWEQVKKEI